VVGISVQAAIGFGFAFFVAPAAFAAFPPEQAVTLVLMLAIAINCLVLFTEQREVTVARREVGILLAAAVPGMAVGAWIVTCSSCWSESWCCSGPASKPWARAPRPGAARRWRSQAA
jgi:uncharacterized membrane protein YfcA